MSEIGLRDITVIGITDRGAASLAPEALALVEDAALLCGGERHLAFFPAHPAERFVIKSNIAGLIERLRREARPAVVLASGDPDCFGIGPLITKEFGTKRVRTLPNLSSAQLAFARLGTSWQDAAILSAHGRMLDAIFPAALTARKVAILTDPQNTPAVIARALLEAGSEDAQADVFEHLDGDREHHVGGLLSEIALQTFDPLNLLIIRRDGVGRRLPLGMPEEAFAHRDGQITKAEVRAVSLAKLGLRDGAVVWDIGAGCGSIAIEASALIGRGTVYAIEHDDEQLAYLAENRRRFAAGNLRIVAGTAPDSLSGLPPPHGVFIGGSGGNLSAIVEAAARALQPAGRIVANVVTLEHLAEITETAGSLGYVPDIAQVSIARSTPLAGLTRLAALNPVFVVSLELPAPLMPQ